MPRIHIHFRYCAHTALFWFATALPLSMLVRYFLGSGLDLFQVGIVMAIASISVVVSEVPTGVLADRIGRVKTYTLANLFATATLCVLLVARNFPGFAIGMAIFGFGRALSSGSLEAWYVDEMHRTEPGKDIQPRLATAGVVASIAVAAGTFGGGALASLFRTLGWPARPIAGVVALDAVIMAINGLWALGLVHRDPSAQSEGAEERTSFGSILRTATGTLRDQPVLYPLFAAGGMAFLGLNAVETFWQPTFTPFLGTDGDLAFGILLAGGFVAQALGATIAPTASRLLGRNHALTSFVSFILFGLALVAVGVAPGFVMAAVGFLLGYFALGLNSPGHMTLLNEAIPSPVRASMLSFASLVGYAGSLGGVALAWAADRFGLSVPWIAAGLAVGVSSSLYLAISPRKDGQPRAVETLE